MARHSVRKSKLPPKPHKDFPLTPHASGKWVKKVAGKFYYFGSLDDPDAAVNEWLERKDGIFAGRDHERHEGIGTDDDVAHLCNEFLAAKEQQLRDGDLVQSTFNDYVAACDRFVEFIGKSRRLGTLNQADFRRYRGSWPTTWGSSRSDGEIASVRAVLNFAFETGIVDVPIRTGPNFKRTSRKKHRIERATKPKKLFTAGEIERLRTAACPQMSAMILLGINAGFGNADCGRLTESMIDFDRQWIEGLRPKSGVERAAWIWPETIDAIKSAIDQRYDNAPPNLADNVFVTKRRQAWFRATGKDDAITAAFGKLKKSQLIAAEVDRLVCDGTKEADAAKRAKARWHGVGFYALRHTFETIAGNAKDQIAVNYVMGHCDDSMAAVYREGIDPQRIVGVCSFVRDWWIEGAGT